MACLTEDGCLEEEDRRRDSLSYQFCCWKIRRNHIPRISVFTDVIMGVASGMTIKFFPLFFKNEVGMSVTEVQFVYVATFVVMIAFSQIARRTAKKVGRVQTILACACAGITLLVAMAVLGTYQITHVAIVVKNGQVRHVENHGLWRTWYIIVPVYVLRTAFMNCCRGLRKSIVMDYVSKADRGKWNGLDGVTRLGWSGSAVLGGWMVDHFGYGYSFVATAALQALASVVWLLLLPLVPVEKPLQSAPTYCISRECGQGGTGRGQLRGEREGGECDGSGGLLFEA